jgi:feS assembly ATPase sufC
LEKLNSYTKIMLEIRNLHASVEGKEILRGINLTINDGEVHVLMGPNGSGKSTLSNVIVGNPKFDVTEGEIIFNGKNLLDLEPEERSHEGVFMSFQAPIEIPGVSMTNFMRAAINAKREYFGQEPLSASDFLKVLREKRKLVGLDAHFMSRGVNEGFSGGERKRNEIFQMAVLEPTFSILDETDSGLDVDALRIVAEGFNQLRKPETSALVITHYQRMLDYLKPDFVHVIVNGKVVKEGDASLGYEIEKRGFDWIKEELAQ